MRAHCAVLLFAAFFGGCGSPERDTEIYNDGTPAVQLDRPEVHRGGYGRSDCLVCHNAVLNLHHHAEVPLDIDLINREARAHGQSRYCQRCHGENGS